MNKLFRTLTTKPRDFQVEDAEDIVREFEGRCLLANQMGLGKSLTALMVALLLKNARPVIVVCPASLKWNWEHEALFHCGMRAEVLETRKVPRKGFRTRHQIIIINYDILPWWIDWLKRLRPQMVVIDECHYVGNRRALRTRAVRLLCRKVPNVLALSGTPLTNRPAELWPILNILRPKLYPAFLPFAKLHCAPKKTPYGMDYSGASRMPLLHRRLRRRLMIRRLKADVLDQLPKKTRTVVPLSIDRPHDYARAANDFGGWLRETDPSKLRTADRAHALVQMGYLKRLAARLKLRQVFAWVDDFLRESDGKLILFAVHKKIIRKLRRRYAQTCVVVDGSVTGQHRKLAVTRFQNDRKIRLFIGNVRAAGVGLNLTAAHTVAFAEMDWTPGLHTQAEDRCYARLGDLHGASVYYLVARGTIEEKLVKLIARKQKVLNAILDGEGRGDPFDIHEKLLRMLKEEPTQTTFARKRKRAAS